MLHDPSDDLATLPDWARKERPMASMLPYVSLVNDVTIRTRGNALFQCIRIDGVNSMTSDDAHLEKIRALFASIIAQIGPDYSFYVHKISKAIETSLPPVSHEGFAKALDTRWQRLCCTNRPSAGLPLTPDGFSLWPRYAVCQEL